MKKLLFLFCFLISLKSFGQTEVIGWHYEAGTTSLQIQFDFDKWAVFQLEGDHIGDVNKMVSQGCVLRKRWGLFFFHPVPGLAYVGQSDSTKIKDALNLKTICNK